MVWEGVAAPGQVVLVKDCLASSGAFVLHALLKKLLLQTEQNVKVAFVALNSPFSHYARVAKKQGCNLMQCKEKGSLVFVDLFSDPNTWKYAMSPEAAGHENPLFPLYTMLRDALKNEKAIGYIMIDDVSLLEVIARGSQDRVLDFLHYCRALATGIGQPQLQRCSLTMLVHEDVYADDKSCTFLTHLDHSSSIMIRVESLSSGHAADVHGQISVGFKHPGKATQNETRNQFRVGENTVFFFTPGERVVV